MPNKDYVSEGAVLNKNTMKDVFVPEGPSFSQEVAKKHPNAEKTMPESRLSSDHVFDPVPVAPFTANAGKHSEHGSNGYVGGTKLANQK